MSNCNCKEEIDCGCQVKDLNTRCVLSTVAFESLNIPKNSTLDLILIALVKEIELLKNR